jgi:hypothetical protein
MSVQQVIVAITSAGSRLATSMGQTFGPGRDRGLFRHHGRNPVNEIATAAKAGTLSALSKTIAPYLLVTSYPTGYALESVPVGLFTPPCAPAIIPIVINNATDKMANRTHEVNKRLKKSIGGLTRTRSAADQF